MNDGVKKAMLEIEIPDELHQRALDGIAKVPKRSVIMYKKVGIIAAALALVMCATVGAAAVGGHLVDIKNIFGTVTGQQYVDATEDISVKFLKSDSGGIIVQPMVNKPNDVPYSEIEELRVGRYCVKNENGDVVIEGNLKADSAKQQGGAQAYDIIVFTAAADELEDGRYTVQISSFIGSSKADQDIEIFGSWETIISFNKNGNYYDIPEMGVEFTVAGDTTEDAPVPDADYDIDLGDVNMHTIDLKDIEPIPNPDAE